MSNLCQKLLHKFSCKIGSITLDPDPDQNGSKILDPDSNSLYLDPQQNTGFYLSLPHDLQEWAPWAPSIWSAVWSAVRARASKYFIWVRIGSLDQTQVFGTGTWCILVLFMVIQQKATCRCMYDEQAVGHTAGGRGGLFFTYSRT